MIITNFPHYFQHSKNGQDTIIPFSKVTEINFHKENLYARVTTVNNEEISFEYENEEELNKDISNFKNYTNLGK